MRALVLSKIVSIAGATYMQKISPKVVFGCSMLYFGLPTSCTLKQMS